MPYTAGLFLYKTLEEINRKRFIGWNFKWSFYSTFTENISRVIADMLRVAYQTYSNYLNYKIIVKKLDFEVQKYRYGLLFFYHIQKRKKWSC